MTIVIFYFSQGRIRSLTAAQKHRGRVNESTLIISNEVIKYFIRVNSLKKDFPASSAAIQEAFTS